MRQKKYNKNIIGPIGVTLFFLLGFCVGRLIHHHWVEECRYYYAPRDIKHLKASYMSDEEINRLVFGGCVIVLKDTVTGDIKAKEIIGLQNINDNVNKSQD